MQLSAVPLIAQTTPFLRIGAITEDLVDFISLYVWDEAQDAQIVCRKAFRNKIKFDALGGFERSVVQNLCFNLLISARKSCESITFENFIDVCFRNTVQSEYRESL